MLKDSDAIATIAVSDIKIAREFYEGTLGFVPDKTEGTQVVAYKSGASKFLVYQSQFAGTNQATVATWAVDDVPAVVDQLKAKGVKFGHYNFPGITHEGDVHVMGARKNAWFTDPDGNILSIVNV